MIRVGTHMFNTNACGGPKTFFFFMHLHKTTTYIFQNIILLFAVSRKIRCIIVSSSPQQVLAIEYCSWRACICPKYDYPVQLPSFATFTPFLLPFFVVFLCIMNIEE